MTQEATKYYRTAKGSHRHPNWICANQSRSIHTGDIMEIPASEVDQWEPCSHCDNPEAIAKWIAGQAKIAEMMCRNSAVAKPQRIYSTCVDCGKEGKVIRGTGRIRSHKI